MILLYLLIVLLCMATLSYSIFLWLHYKRLKLTGNNKKLFIYGIASVLLLHLFLLYPAAILSGDEARREARYGTFVNSNTGDTVILDKSHVTFRHRKRAALNNMSASYYINELFYNPLTRERWNSPDVVQNVGHFLFNTELTDFDKELAVLNPSGDYVSRHYRYSLEGDTMILGFYRNEQKDTLLIHYIRQKE